MAIIKDLYNLKYSEKIITEGLEESVVDLSLETSSQGGASVTGTVKDTEGTPIENATVKIFDAQGVPFAHTETDGTGSYSFVNLKGGSYSISAVKSGYIITVPDSFYLQENETKSYAFTLSSETSLALCSIAGHIYSGDGEDKKLIGDATISLLNSTTKETVATTRSADDGEYLFYGVTAGNYILKATKQGYSASNDISVTAVNDTIINYEIKLTIDPQRNVGTISGYVKHNNNIVAGAFVGLYDVDDVTKTETLKAITKTNAEGLYMFGGVVTGNYKVKAKLTQTTT